jgi:MurNAc alpha-1-phosphate uridylyltransferase
MSGVGDTVGRTAMVLAAGYGRRMRPLTDTRPKPLVQLLQRPLIDRALDRLAAAGVTTAVINTHYLADRLHAHLEGRAQPRVRISHEPDELLDTGGGVARALPDLGRDPFFVLNGDMFWLDGYTPALERMAAAWDAERMDALLLVNKTTDAIGYAGLGDFMVDIDGRARRRHELEVAPFAFTGIQILQPRLFDYAPEGPFSLNLLYDQAEAGGRLFAMPHDGLWFHLSTPADVETAETELIEMGFRHERDGVDDRDRSGADAR